MQVILSMASFIVNSKGLKIHDIKQQIDIIWDALEAYREDLISEGDELHDAIWEEICNAMALIEKDLNASKEINK